MISNSKKALSRDEVAEMLSEVLEDWPVPLITSAHARQLLLGAYLELEDISLWRVGVGLRQLGFEHRMLQDGPSSTWKVRWSQWVWFKPGWRKLMSGYSGKVLMEAYPTWVRQAFCWPIVSEVCEHDQTPSKV